MIKKLKSISSSNINSYLSSLKFFIRFYFLRWISHFLSFNKFRSDEEVFDYVFICPPKKQGWILFAIAFEIQKRVVSKSKIIHLGDNLPIAKNYIFMHYIFYYFYLSFNFIKGSKKIIYMTHFEQEKHNLTNLNAIKLLNTVDLVICMNTKLKDYIIKHNFSKGLQTVIGGADPNIFFENKKIKKEYIGLSTAYYGRKSPDKILDVVKNMPNENFILLGRGWEDYDRYDELITLPNFTYKNIKYTEYPNYYNKMKVFLSLSEIEGGPIPLIESMMCNVVPVVTNTGVADDVIQNGINGFIIPVNATTELVIETIKKALTHNTNVSGAVSNYTWDKFSESILFSIDNNKL